jgi:uncharacterized protein involved in exopolysaccharide biosynthesis
MVACKIYFWGKDKVLEKALDRLSKDIVLKSVKDTNVVHIYCRNSDPLIANNILKLLIRYFIDKHIDIYGDRALAVFTRKYSESKLELDNAEDQLTNFKKEQKIYEIDEQTRLLLLQKKEIDDLIRANSNRFNEINKEILSVNQQINSIPSEITLYTEIHTDSLRSARDKLLELQLREQEYIKKYSADNRYVKNIREDIISLTSHIKNIENNPLKSERVGRNPPHEHMVNKKHRLLVENDIAKNRKGTLLLSMNKIDEDLARINQIKHKLNQLERDVESKELSFKNFKTKIDEATLADTLDKERLTNIRLIQEPSMPSEALGLSKLARVILATFLGLIAGIIIAITSEKKRGTCLTPKMLEMRLGVPILAVFRQPYN